MKAKISLHSIYLFILSAIVVATTGSLGFIGYSFYSIPVEDRYYHPQYDWFKPSGIMGHGLGIVGTVLIVIGVVLYIVSKRYGIFNRIIRLKYILEFHIFLCTLGPIMILFHTSFKFGGIVSIAFWSMVIVVLSGVVGRYIYIQIPRNISGEELTASEIEKQQDSLIDQIRAIGLSEALIREFRYIDFDKEKTFFHKLIVRRKHLDQVNKTLQSIEMTSREKRQVMSMVEAETRLSLRNSSLKKMQDIFKYWHVAHRPFALIMLVIVTIHVIVTLLFGFTWIS